MASEERNASTSSTVSKRRLWTSPSSRKVTGSSRRHNSANAAVGNGASGGDDAGEKRSDIDIMDKHGLPAWNLFSGNLPVITSSRHNPRDVHGITGPSPYEYFSGNLPVMSHVLHKTKGRSSDYLQPGWVHLQEPTGKRFWWNTKYRTRRERRPIPTDDGSEENVPYQGPIWIEAFDSRPEVIHRYYINMKEGYIQWSRPPDFDEPGMGEAYDSVWETQWNKEQEKPSYFNKKTFELVDEIPWGFDGFRYEEYWVSKTRKEILEAKQENDAKNKRVMPDHIIKVDGSIMKKPPKGFKKERERVPVWVSQTLRDPLKEAAEKVKGGRDDEMLFINTLSGEVKNEPPTPPPNPDELFSDIEPPPLPSDAGKYKPPPNLNDPEAWGGRKLKDFSSWVKKQGGGRSILGRKKFQWRYLMLKNGKLKYYKHEAEAHTKEDKPRKNMTIDPLNYDVDQMPSKPRHFRLVPIEDRTALAFSRDSKHTPFPDRVFEFQCEDTETTEKWLVALGETVILSLDEEEEDEEGEEDQ